MPIFDYECPECGFVKEYIVKYHDAKILCSVCLDHLGRDKKVFMVKLPAVPNMHLFPIDGIHLKHVCSGGKTFHSKNEMKKYARDNNVELGALL